MSVINYFVIFAGLVMLKKVGHCTHFSQKLIPDTTNGEPEFLIAEAILKVVLA